MEGPSDEDYQLSEGDLRAIKLMETPRAWPPLATREQSGYVIDLVSAPYRELPAHRRLLLLLLQLSVKDRATELRIEPWLSAEGECDPGAEDRGIRLYYEAKGELLELVPPPPDFLPYLARELEVLSGLASLRLRAAHGLRRLDGQAPGPRRGRFTLRVGDSETEVEVYAHSGDFGERYYLKFGPIAEDASEKAQAAMRRIFEAQHT